MALVNASLGVGSIRGSSLAHLTGVINGSFSAVSGASEPANGIGVESAVGAGIRPVTGMGGLRSAVVSAIVRGEGTKISDSSSSALCSGR